MSNPKYTLANQAWFEKQSKAVQANCVRVKALDSISECGFIPATRPASTGANGAKEPEIQRFGYLTRELAFAYGKRVEVVDEDEKAYAEWLAAERKRREAPPTPPVPPVTK